MHSRSILRVLAASSLALLLASPAHALFRTYLASMGNDANPCTLVSPCRLLPAALAAVDDGGEIWMLDSANFNTAMVTINKSVSIMATPGSVGSVLAVAGPAINVAASGLRIGLRNLVLAPLPGAGGTVGIFMTGNSVLFVENALIANLPSHGILASNGSVVVSGSVFRNNSGYGMQVTGNAVGAVSHTQFSANFGAFLAQATADATATLGTVTDCSIIGGQYGVIALSTRTTGSSATARVAITRTTIDNTSYALVAQTGPGSPDSMSLVVGHSMISNNFYSFYQAGPGTNIASLGNNQLTNNNTSIGTLSGANLQ